MESLAWHIVCNSCCCDRINNSFLTVFAARKTVMRMQRLGLLGTIAAAVCLVGCDQINHDSTASPDRTTSEDVQKEVGEAAETTGKYVGQKKDEFLSSMNEKLAKLDAQIDELKDRGSRLAEDQKKEWNEQLADLETKRQQFKNEYDEASKASGEAWGDVKKGVESAWNDLKNAVDDAAQRFQSEEEPVKDDPITKPTGESTEPSPPTPQ
jgi:hypothetical protein